MDRRLILFFLVSFGGIIALSAVRNLLFPPPPPSTAPTVAAAKPAEPTRPAAQPNAEAVALALSNAFGNPLGRPLHPAPDAEAQRVFEKRAIAAKAEAARKAQAEAWAKDPDKVHVLTNAKIDVAFSERGAALKSYTPATRDYARPDPEGRPLLLFSDDDDGKLKELGPVERNERLSFRFFMPEQDLTWKLAEKGADRLIFETEVPARNVRVRK